MRKDTLGRKIHPRSKTWRERMSKALKGRVGAMTGKIMSDETKDKIGKANKGRKHSPESIERQREKMLGRKMSEEQRLKMIGKHHSKETRLKMSEKHKAEKHWNWQGGISLMTKRIRGSFKYRQWRSDVFTRDNFTCGKCDKRGGSLEADHFPKMFSQILKEYSIKTVEDAEVCEELWNINNGRTLCEECHDKVHLAVH